MTVYLLDTNVFIQAKNLHYGFDFCPAFWDWLVVQNEAGKVASIEKVGDELRAGARCLRDVLVRLDSDLSASALKDVLASRAHWRKRWSRRQPVQNVHELGPKGGRRVSICATCSPAMSWRRRQLPRIYRSFGPVKPPRIASP